MINFLKVRNVKDPVWNFDENAGIDFYIPEKDSFTPNELKEFGEHVYIEGNTIKILPHCDIKIPAGIKSKFPKNVGLLAVNKSGVATKKKLVTGACLIDTSYQGEWHLHLINTSDEDQYLEFGTKCVQFMPLILYTAGCTVTTDAENFFTETTSRGDRGFGEGTGIN
ncbi:MAG: hypothetical protein IJZ79_01505 [Bacilli bacterium]|nr:hypothetical protein [Bacilli bacterium]